MPFVSYLDSSPTLSPAAGPSIAQTVQIPDDLFQPDPSLRRTATQGFWPSPSPSPSLRGRGHGQEERQDNARKHVSTTDVGSYHVGNGIRCRYFNKGRCKKGDGCPFSHVATTRVADDTGDSHHVGNGIACRYFKKRSCTKDDRCPFSHVTAPRSAIHHVSNGSQ
jgi:RNA-binding, Nab2-type zinc finger